MAHTQTNQSWSDAVGMVETRGLIAALEALDTMAKAAQIRMLSVRRAGSGLVTVIVAGDVAAVQSAVAAGSAAASRTGEELIGSNVIPRPHPDLWPALMDSGVWR
ncbi:MAG: BMC domain-containing protein [Sulfobacillus sp.]